MDNKLIFFDTEFTKLSKNGELISIGLVTEEGKQFYAEFNDFKLSDCTLFVKDNVIPNLKFYNKMPNKTFVKTDPFDYNVLGDHSLIKNHLTIWLKNFKKFQITFVADVLMYDWVLFVDLISDLKDDMPIFPKNINYIPLDLANLFSFKGLDSDLNRVEYVGKNFKQHNSLEDAKQCMWCYKKLMLT